MITVTVTTPEEARAAVIVTHDLPAGMDFRVLLHDREVAASMPPPAPGWKAMTLDLKQAR
jgi:hypothetical protein